MFLLLDPFFFYFMHWLHHFLIQILIRSKKSIHNEFLIRILIHFKKPMSHWAFFTQFLISAWLIGGADDPCFIASSVDVASGQEDGRLCKRSKIYSLSSRFLCCTACNISIRESLKHISSIWLTSLYMMANGYFLTMCCTCRQWYQVGRPPNRRIKMLSWITQRKNKVHSRRGREVDRSKELSRRWPSGAG